MCNLLNTHFKQIKFNQLHLLEFKEIFGFFTLNELNNTLQLIYEFQQGIQAC